MVLLCKVFGWYFVEWYFCNEQCEEIECLEKQHKTKEMYDKVKELNKKCTLKGGGSITDKNGKILFDQEEIDKRWVEYIKELYDDD